MAHARPQPGRGRPRSRPESSPCPCFWEPGQPRENPAPSLLSLAGALVRHPIREGESPPCPPPPAPPARPVLGGLRQPGTGSGREPQGWALPPGAAPVPACRANTLLLLVSSRGQPPAGRAAPGHRGPRAPRRPVPHTPGDRGTRLGLGAGELWGNEQTHQLTN